MNRLEKNNACERNMYSPSYNVFRLLLKAIMSLKKKSAFT